MSFKSRQRAKHSHLFGDDPLSASSPVTDDPLFGSSTTSPSRSPSRSPKLTDPLRKSNTSSNGSIFGDIDVSKLGGGSLLTSSKRSTFRNESPLDEDALFGGNVGRRQQQQQQQQQQKQQQRFIRSSSPTSTRSSFSDSGSHRSADSADNHHPISLPPSSPKPLASTPHPSLPATLPERPATVSPAGQIKPMERKQPPPPVPERPTPRKSQQPPPPPPRLVLSEEQPKRHQQQQQQLKPHQLSERTLPPVNGKTSQKQEQQQQQSSLFSRFMVNKKKQQQQEQHEVQQEKQEDGGHRSDGPYYDDPELLASVVNDALRFDSPSMIPSVSTPQTESNPWSVVDPMKTTSSPLIKTHQEIEPAKRTVFADLIDSWHGKKTAAATAPPPLQDDDQFFERIAVEQRDIGFAGIQDEQHINSTSNNNHSHHHLWDIEETDNPWR